MLLWEIDREDGRVFIHADQDGLRTLIAHIEVVLREADDPTGFRPAHTHLWTPAWGGDDLDEPPLFGEKLAGEVVNEVKIYCWHDAQSSGSASAS